MPRRQNPNIRRRVRGVRFTFGPEWPDIQSADAHLDLVELAIKASENQNIPLVSLQEGARLIAQMFSFQRGRVVQIHPVRAAQKIAILLGIPEREAYIEELILTHLRNAHPDYLRKLYNA